MVEELSVSGLRFDHLNGLEASSRPQPLHQMVDQFGVSVGGVIPLVVGEPLKFGLMAMAKLRAFLVRGGEPCIHQLIKSPFLPGPDPTPETCLGL